jgi:hypothetical protein
MSIQAQRWRRFPLANHAELVLRRFSGHILAADGAELASFLYGDIRIVARRDRRVGVRFTPTASGLDSVLIATPSESVAQAVEVALRDRSALG